MNAEEEPVVEVTDFVVKFIRNDIIFVIMFSLEKFLESILFEVNQILLLVELGMKKMSSLTLREGLQC